MRRVLVSGYFDPLHVGHLELIERAKKLGDHLIVVVNNDFQAKLKKGKAFMPESERVKIIQALKNVDEVILSVDNDRTICKTLEKIHPDIFANGGFTKKEITGGVTIPEGEVCNRLGILMCNDLGEKIQSSSNLTGLIAFEKRRPSH